MMDLWNEINIDPTALYGKCPFCSACISKIVWGWAEVYYDMLCPNGHIWTFYFTMEKIKESDVKIKG